MRTAIEILEDFWYDVGYFIRYDSKLLLKQVGKFVIGGGIIIALDSKEFIEEFIKKRKRGGLEELPYLNFRRVDVTSFIKCFYGKDLSEERCLIP